MTQKQKKNPYKLMWFQALTLYVSLGLLFITGALLYCRERFSSEFTFYLVRIHGYAVPLFLLSLGSLLAKHATLSWKANRNRLTGSLVALECFVLVLTGSFLYYFGGEVSRRITSNIHYWAGVSLAVLMPLHMIAGFFTRKKSEEKKSRSHP